jgi:carboxyl-terminal processing protease
MLRRTLQHAAALGIALVCAGAAFGQPLQPRSQRSFDDQERDICKAVMEYYPHHALLPSPMESDFERLVVRRYLSALDPRKLYFDQPDVDAILAKSAGLEAKLRAGDMRLAYEIYELYRRRVHERVPLALARLKQPPDFTGDETLDLDVRSWKYCASVVESSQRWEKWTKYELLWTRLPGESVAQRAERIERRYQRLLRDVDEAEDDDVLEMFLDCVVKCYDPHAQYLSERTLSFYNS